MSMYIHFQVKPPLGRWKTIKTFPFSELSKVFIKELAREFAQDLPRFKQRTIKNTNLMKQIKVSFTGRLVGAIGSTHANTVLVEAPISLTAENATGADLELIYAQLYAKHEHISNIKIVF